MTILKILLKVFNTILIIIYPFIIYYCVLNNLYTASVSILLFILALKLITGGKRNINNNLLLFLIGCSLCILFILSKNFIFLKLYPILVNILLLFTFGSTLFYGNRSLIEIIASLKTPKEEQDLFFKNYCRHITIVWCIFFIFNGAIAAITAIWCSDKIWAFYTGFVSYFLIALMFLAEYVYRNIVKSKRSIEKK
jgi:uncharacterized membrane protein